MPAAAQFMAIIKKLHFQKLMKLIIRLVYMLQQKDQMN